MVVHLVVHRIAEARQVGQEQRALLDLLVKESLGQLALQVPGVGQRALRVLRALAEEILVVRVPLALRGLPDRPVVEKPETPELPGKWGLLDLQV